MGRQALKRGGLGLILAGLVAFGWRQISRSTYSNIYPGDYVGPQTCGKCHQTNLHLWENHSHRVMNTAASESTVHGDFSGVTLAYGPGTVRFGRNGSDFTMEVFAGDRLVRRHKVTRTVGSLYMQYYVGKQVFGPEPPDHLTYTLESKLPFAYCYALKRWVPEPYLDSTVDAEQTYLDGKFYVDAPPMHNWNVSCMTCHNTYPYVARLWHQPPPNDKSGIWQGGFPAADVETTLPREHQGRIGIEAWRTRAMDPSELVTFGISCETCHFGGREHAVEGKKIRFVPTSSTITTSAITIKRAGTSEPVRSNRKDPYVVNSICKQCHNAGLAEYPNGGESVNSSEALDMAGGACTSQIKCTDCHNPHRKGPPTGSPDQPLHVAACLQCHKKYEDPQNALAHSHHAEGSHVSCLDCHMPRIVAGLDTIARSHRISSPTDGRMFASGSPNACNLCHLDRPIGWTVEELAKGWGRTLKFGDGQGVEYGGSPQTPVGEFWLRHPNPFVRLAAADAYARSPLVSDPAPYLLAALDDTHAFNRTLALISLQRILGRPLQKHEYDLVASPEVRQKQLRALMSSGVLSKELGRRQPAAYRAANAQASQGSPAIR